MTYYKYAEREANSQINWAEVSKGLSDTILQIDKDRQAKKAAIDEETRKAMLELADVPKGENTTASEWTIKYANDMMNYRLTIDRLLKQGKMSLRDYQVAAQNSKDSTHLVFTIAKEYQDQYKVIMDRAKEIDPQTGLPMSSRFESEIAAFNESLANISTTVPYINSTNGMVYLATATPGKDGVQQMGDNYVSLQALRNRVNAKIDRYDLSGGIKNQTDKLGDYTISQLGKTNFRRTGVVTEITDPTLRATYQKWEDDTVKQILSSSYQMASIMGDSMFNNPKSGNPYRITLDRKEFEADKTGDVILMANQNGSGPLMPEFKEGQREEVSKFVKSQIVNYIDQKAEKDVFQIPDVYRPSVAEMEYYKGVSDSRERSKNNLNMAGKLYYGNDKEADAAAQYFRDVIPNVKDVDRNSEGVVLTFNDGKSKTIKFKDLNGQVIPQADWLSSATALHGITDVNRAIKESGYKPSGSFNPNSKASAITTTPAKEDLGKEYSSYVNSAIPSILKPTEITSTYYGQKVKGFKSDDGKSILSEEEVADKLNSSLQNLGFEVTVPTKYGNYISIRNKDGVETEVSIDDPTTALKTIQGFVVGNVPGKDAIAQTTYLKDLKSKGVIGGAGAKWNK